MFKKKSNYPRPLNINPLFNKPGSTATTTTTTGAAAAAARAAAISVASPLALDYGRRWKPGKWIKNGDKNKRYRGNKIKDDEDDGTEETRVIIHPLRQESTSDDEHSSTTQHSTCDTLKSTCSSGHSTTRPNLTNPFATLPSDNSVDASAAVAASRTAAAFSATISSAVATAPSAAVASITAPSTSAAAATRQRIEEVVLIHVEEPPYLPCLDCKVDALRLKADLAKRRRAREEERKRWQERRKKEEEIRKKGDGRENGEKGGTSRWDSRRTRRADFQGVPMTSKLRLDVSEPRQPKRGQGMGRGRDDVEEVVNVSLPPLPVYYDIFGGDDSLTTASKFRPLPLRPRNAGDRRNDASVAAATVSFASASITGPADHSQAISLLPASRFSAEQQFLHLFNEETLLAFFEYVKNSDWKYGRDKVHLDEKGFRNRNGVKFHNDCWSFVIDDSYV